MREMQFTAIILMSLLTLKLLLLPSKAIVSPVMRRAWWLMTLGTALIGVQFLLQYIFRLRAMGVTQAVMLNLALFIPCSWLLSLSLICLQRRGFICRSDRYVGLLTWVVALGLMAFAAATDGVPLLAGSEAMLRAEIAASVCYMAMMAFYLWHHFKNIRFLIHALKNYYDEDLGVLLQWMRVSAIMLPIMGMMVPMMIFTDGMWLFFFGLTMFLFIFFLVDSFFSYVVSTAPAKVKEAEEQEYGEFVEQEDNPRISQQHAPMHRVAIAVDQWVSKGGHLKSGLKLPTVADELGVPRYLLTAWLRNQDLKYADWMTDLRIEEATRVLTDHPDWSNEYIAQHCGFGDRTYFQKKFKEKTGMTPADYVSLHQ
jgi:AraC-like DNA-binding protein